jgi:NAD/NADP transhydrogenase alpha subunit
LARLALLLLVAIAFAVTTGVKLLGFLSVVLATINLCGGFLVTDRMLKMVGSGLGKYKGAAG